MKTISYDHRAGQLEDGLVWSWAVELREGFTYAETNHATSEDLRECAEDSRHVTGIAWTKVVLDVFGSDRQGDFVPTCDMGCAIATSSFREKLEGARLRGVHYPLEVGIAENQGEKRRARLFLMDVVPLKHGPSRWVVNGAENLCPECRKIQMVCHVCGYKNWPRCEVCDQWTLVNKEASEYSNPNGFLLDTSFLDEPVIIEGKNWEGSDFFQQGGQWCVTSGAKNWLERVHAAPVCFKPALLNVEGMDPALLKKLQEDR